MKKVNLYVDDETWQAFRIACLQSHISASQQFGLLMVQWLHEYEHLEDKAAEAEESAYNWGSSPDACAG